MQKLPILIHLKVLKLNQ